MPVTGDKEQPRVPFPALPSAHPPNEFGASNGSPCMGSDPFNGSKYWGRLRMGRRCWFHPSLCNPPPRASPFSDNSDVSGDFF